MIITIRILFILLTIALIALLGVNLKTINGAQGLVILAALYAGIGQITTWPKANRQRRVEKLEFFPQGRKIQ
jgi:succinate-acetate transporter protein